MIKINTKVVGGRIDRNRSVLNDAIQMLDGYDICITIEKARRKRSNPQNKYYWGVVVFLITKTISDMGNLWTAEDTHLYLRNKFLLESVPVNDSGEFIDRAKSTTELATFEMETYLEQVRAWAAQTLGVVVPLPNEDLQLFD